MSISQASPDLAFEDAVAALHRDDFSWLGPLFTENAGRFSPIRAWVAERRFAADPAAVNEALACACFLGETALAEFLLDHAADLVAGNGTGLNGFHWAANRGQLDTVRALIARRLPMEDRSSYGGTVLGSAVWASVHEPKPAHSAIIKALVAAGAVVESGEYRSPIEMVKTDASFRDAIMILDVRDVDAALRYYCEQLGFDLDFRNAQSPDNYAGIRRGNVLLHMQWQSAGAFRDGTAGHLRVRIDVADPDALYAEYLKRGVEHLGPPPDDTTWGTREFAFRDPDGNHLAFFLDH